MIKYFGIDTKNTVNYSVIEHLVPLCNSLNLYKKEEEENGC